MSQEEYIKDLKQRSAELEYEYWTTKVEIVKSEKEMHDKIKSDLMIMIKETTDFYTPNKNKTKHSQFCACEDCEKEKNGSGSLLN